MDYKYHLTAHDGNSASVSTLGFHQLKIPVHKWKCKMNSGFVLFLDQDHPPPCWLHRMMQRLVLGFKWERLNENHQ